MTGFQTFMTGEFYALLSQHSLLARSIDRDAAFDEASFSLGQARTRQGGGLWHNAFGTGTLSLFARFDASQRASYLHLSCRTARRHQVGKRHQDGSRSR